MDPGPSSASLRARVRLLALRADLCRMARWMCRMFGLVASRPVAQRALLSDAPRSLGALSREHPDGWGVALAEGSEWRIQKSVRCAAACKRYDALSRSARASLAIAHVRQKTVGQTALENTHPFRRGRFVLAHNGTVRDGDGLAARTSAERLRELEGQTDSERLFAFLMSFVDAAGDTEIGLARAVCELLERSDPGSMNFLLSDGRRLFAFRWGRTLFTLRRGPSRHRASRRTPAVVVASERLTDEPWVEVEQGTLLVVEPDPLPAARVVLRA